MARESFQFYEQAFISENIPIMNFSRLHTQANIRIKSQHFCEINYPLDSISLFTGCLCVICPSNGELFTTCYQHFLN